MPDFTSIEKDGALFIAAKCAHKMRFLYPFLVAAQNSFDFEQIDPNLCAMIKRQNLSYPTKEWHDDVAKMYQIFLHMNPPDKIESKKGITQGFKEIFKQKFPQYSEKLLHLCAQNCVYVRLRFVNENARTRISKSETAPNTDRGAKKQAEYEMC